ncbi:DUF167 domain-containing protein [Candidatus Microgenomates bacterium]|nr:DUF167 domain-containing protein [Candidatus Microgenomates bacterium]
MKIFVKAKPLAKKIGIEKVDENHFIVSVKEPPVRGLANQAIAKALADYFGVSSSCVFLITGFSSRQKTFEIKK